jgi:hypothetical protein
VKFTENSLAGILRRKLVLSEAELVDGAVRKIETVEDAWRWIMRFIALVFMVTGSLFAQTATLTGRVSDPSGAIVPGVQVEVRAVGTGSVWRTETNSAGYYTVTALSPGQYDLAASKLGFAAIQRRGLSLAVQQVARVDMVLRLGDVAESVTVSGTEVLLESEGATLGQVIGSRQLAELPLLGRNPYALAMLVPGVRASLGVNNLPVNQIATISYSINGQRATMNEFLLDGAPNSAPSQNQPVINANPDAVQEFKVETNSYAAEYGRAAGGVFNVVTKSGTNETHFNLYEFFRHDKLTANNFFANMAGTPRPPFRFNQFGGTLGGPVYLPKLYDGTNRTFFFASAEFVRFQEGLTFTGTVPNEAQRGGDFSGLRNAAGNPVILYDPLSTQANPAGGFTRQPFTGNRIPADRIDPVARNVTSFWPLPNAPGNLFTGVNNFSRPDSNSISKNTFSARLDHSFSERHRIFGRYSYDDTPWIRALPYGADNPASPGAGPHGFGRQNAVLEDTHILSPTWLATVRYSVTRLTNNRRAHSDGFDIKSLGFPAAFEGELDALGSPRMFPAITVTGLGVAGSLPGVVLGGALGSTGFIRLGNTVHALVGSTTKNLTRHTLKIGGELRVIQFNNHQTGNTSTVFSFSPQWTQGPNPNVSSNLAGSGFASFLLGVGGGGVTPAPALAQSNRYQALFIQDSWKITPQLTLNLGMRYEYESPRVERFNQFANFDYGASSPLQAPGLDVRGGLTFVGVQAVPRFQSNPDRNNWAPRAGFAYSVTPKTIIRGGGGLFYAPFTGINTESENFGISGFEATTSLVTSLDGVTPLNYLRNPYPEGLNHPTGSALGLATLLGQDVSFFDRGNRVGYSSQWNVNLQQQLPGNVLVETGYVGSRGLGMPQTRQWNQLPDGALTLGDGLRQQVDNPFFGQVSVGPLSQPRVARAQLMRPFPQFQTVQSRWANWASSSYHALQAKAEKRHARGLSLLASYTFSKLLDYGTGTFAGEALSGQNFQNWNNLAAEWSPSTIDQTHRLILNVVYELPGPNNWGRVGNKLFGGWQVAGIWSGTSGGPLGVTSAVNNTFSQGGGQRPNWTGVNPKLDQPIPQRWFDTSQFSVPTAFRFGNAPRTFNGSRSDSLTQLDFTLSKNTRFGEHYNIQFRAEFFNLTNTARFAPPNVAFGNPQFGVVSAQGNSPRIIQFGLKLSR